MSRTARLLVAAGAAVLLLTAIVIGLVVWNSGLQANPVAATCGNAVSLYFEDDAAMRKATEELAEDGRVDDVRSETRQQAEHRLDRWFSGNRPDDRLQAVSAVHFAARNPAQRKRLTAELEEELPGVKAAHPADCSAKRGERTPQISSVGGLRCGQAVSVHFAGDDEMRAAVDTVRRDKRVVKVVAVPRAEAYQRAKAVLRDNPDLQKLVRPEDVPPWLEIVTTPQTDPRTFGTEISSKLRGTKGVQTTQCIAVPHPVVPPKR